MSALSALRKKHNETIGMGAVVKCNGAVFMCNVPLRDCPIVIVTADVAGQASLDSTADS